MTDGNTPMLPSHCTPLLPSHCTPPFPHIARPCFPHFARTASLTLHAPASITLHVSASRTFHIPASPPAFRASASLTFCVPAFLTLLATVDNVRECAGQLQNFPCHICAEISCHEINNTEMSFIVGCWSLDKETYLKLRSLDVYLL